MLLKNLVSASQNSIRCCWFEWVQFVNHAVAGYVSFDKTKQVKLTTWWKHFKQAIDSHEHLMLLVRNSPIYRDVISFISKIDALIDTHPIHFLNISYETEKLASYMNSFCDEVVLEDVHVDNQTLQNILTPRDSRLEWYLGFLLLFMETESAIIWLVNKWELGIPKVVAQFVYMPRVSTYIQTVGTLFDIGGPIKFENGKYFLRKSMSETNLFYKEYSFRLEETQDKSLCSFVLDEEVKNVQIF